MSAKTPALRCASAVSSAPGAGAAVEQACARLGKRLGGPVDLALFFVSRHHAGAVEDIGQCLMEALPAQTVVGVTAEGVIGARRELEQGPGLSVLALRLPGLRCEPFCFRTDDPGAVAAAVAAAAAVPSTNGPQPAPEAAPVVVSPVEAVRAVLLLPDPFSTPIRRLLGELQELLPGVPVVGGLASGAREPGGNRLFLNGEVTDQGAVGLMLGGNLRVECVVSQGCRPLGRPLVITKAKRNVLLELGGRSAWDAVQELAQQITPAERRLINTHGLLVGRVIDEYRERFGRGDFLIRGIVGADQERGYLAVADPSLRVGQTIQFHVRDKRTAREDLEMLLEAQRFDTPPVGALLVSCNGRGAGLFGRPNVDANTVHKYLGDVPLAGFFAAGEIGPVGHQSFVHGHTASVVLLREG